MRGRRGRGRGRGRTRKIVETAASYRDVTPEQAGPENDGSANEVDVPDDPGKAEDAQPEDQDDDEDEDDGFHPDTLLEDDDEDEDDGDVFLEDSSGSEAGPRTRRGKTKTPQKRRASAVAAPATDVSQAEAANALELYPAHRTGAGKFLGTLQRYARGSRIMYNWYGGLGNTQDWTTWDRIYRRWWNGGEIPNRSGPGSEGANGPSESPWLPEGFQAAQRDVGRKWLEDMHRHLEASTRGTAQVASSLSVEAAQEYVPHPKGGLAVLMGPQDGQEEMVFTPGRSACVDKVGTVTAVNNGITEGDAPAGWLLDAGGLTLAMQWAPLSNHGPQYLALTAVPHTDQEVGGQAESMSPEDIGRTRGSIQIWVFAGDGGSHGYGHPVPRLPVLGRVLCLDWGRVRRLQWCPVQLDSDTTVGLLAVLCGDGMVRVVEVDRHEDGSTLYDHVTAPLVTLGLDNESSVYVTALTWVNTNRLALGHSDGSVALWSLHPRVMLSRQLIHTNAVVDMASAYPSYPYHVASVPTTGQHTLVDLSSPSFEITSFGAFSINLRPNLLQWNDVLQGWFLGTPASRPFESRVSFTHVKHFPQFRTVTNSESLPSCLASGGPHPFLLVGHLDGSVWSMNPMRRLFVKTAKDMGLKVKLLHHEYRPRDAFPTATQQAVEANNAEPVRGASRMLQGWRPITNTQHLSEWGKQALENGGATGGKKKVKRRKSARQPVEDIDGSGGEQSDEDGGPWVDPARLVIHDPSTRITVMAWNPNNGFGCWAAAAIGSGLVRVMDLGQRT